MHGSNRGCFDCALGEAMCIFDASELQTGLPERIVDGRDISEISALNLLLDESLGFPEADRRVAPFAELRQHPGGIGERFGNQGLDVGRPEHGKRALDAQALAHSPLPTWSVIAARWMKPMVYACCVFSASWRASAAHVAASPNLPSPLRLRIRLL